MNIHFSQHCSHLACGRRLISSSGGRLTWIKKKAERKVLEVGLGAFIDKLNFPASKLNDRKSAANDKEKSLTDKGFSRIETGNKIESTPVCTPASATANYDLRHVTFFKAGQ